MITKLNALVGKKVMVYGVAEGLSICHLDTLVGPMNNSKTYHVGKSPIMITFQLENVKAVEGNTVELKLMEHRTRKLVRKTKLKEKK